MYERKVFTFTDSGRLVHKIYRKAIYVKHVIGIFDSRITVKIYSIKRLKNLL